MSHHCCMLVHIVQVAEGCRGLKLPQTAHSAGLLTSLSELFPLPLAVSCRGTNSCSLAETPDAGCGCSPGPSPRGQVGTRSMTCDLVSSSESSADVTSCSAVHQHQCQTPVILLPVSGPVSCQELTSDLFEVVSSSGRFTDGAVRQPQLQMRPKLPDNKLSRLTENKQFQPSKCLPPWILFYLGSFLLLL